MSRERAIRDREIRLLREDAEQKLQEEVNRQAAAARAAAAAARLDDRDYDFLAERCVASMRDSGAVVHPGGGRYVLAISKFENDFESDVDSAQLLKKIRIKLLRSGAVTTTTAIGAHGPEDPMTRDVTELRELHGGQPRKVVLPDLSLTGRVVKRATNAAGGRYALYLTLTQLDTGLALWEEELTIVKAPTAP